jgi:hypothetical protein
VVRLPVAPAAHVVGGDNGGPGLVVGGQPEGVVHALDGADRVGHEVVVPDVGELARVVRRARGEEPLERSRELADDTFNVSTLNPPSIVGCAPGRSSAAFAKLLVLWASIRVSKSVRAPSSRGCPGAGKRLDLDVHETGDRLVVRVGDDGSGGAVLKEQGGLCSLRDRVAAAGGTFRVTNRPGGGTIVEAERPCAS